MRRSIRIGETAIKIFHCVLATFVLVCTIACHEANDSISPAITPQARQHVQSIVATLPAENFARQMVEGGRFGDGIRHSWMDAMKGQGVTAVDVTIRMTWFLGPHWPYAIAVRYFSDYGESQQVVDEGVLNRLRKDGSVDAVKRAALTHFRDGFWMGLPHSVLRPFQADLEVTLYDNEWLPIPRRFYHMTGL